MAVRRQRDLRAAGLRPITIWVPDTRRPGVADECRRQAQTVAAADEADHHLAAFLDAVLVDSGSADMQTDSVSFRSSSRA